MKARIAIVCSRFNEFISKPLLQACLAELKRQGVTDKQIISVWVPGSFEIPVVAYKLANKKTVDAVICLGAVIKGETYHFNIVANEVSRGVMDVSLKTGKPIIMGVLTTNTVGQAQKRSQDKGADNKGRDAAATALEMITLLRKI